MLNNILVVLVFAVLAGIILVSIRYRRVLRSSEVTERILRDQIEIAAQQAQANRAQLEAILSTSEDAILLVDQVGICKPLNARARLLFPPSAQNTLVGLTQSAELDNLLSQTRMSASDSLPTVGEVTMRPQGYKTMQVLMTTVTAEQAPDAPSYLILLRDITDLRRLETIRRDFVANVSHELRTPLTSVKAMAETLLNGALEDAEFARHFLEIIVQETDRLVRLSADLLDLSRIESHMVRKSDHDIANLIDEIVARLESQRNDADVALALSVERPLIVPCDRDEIAQVLVNLVDNAIKYTSRGGEIGISGNMQQGSIVVEVSDTGIGILKQDLPRLFERFYRTDKARSRQSGGTGLGLSIVKHIVERHGGELWVKSEYNHGSTFGFSLPQADVDPTGSADDLPRTADAGPSSEYIVLANPTFHNSTQQIALLP